MVNVTNLIFPLQSFPIILSPRDFSTFHRILKLTSWKSSEKLTHPFFNSSHKYSLCVCQVASSSEQNQHDPWDHRDNSQTGASNKYTTSRCTNKRGRPKPARQGYHLANGQPATTRNVQPCLLELTQPAVWLTGLHLPWISIWLLNSMGCPSSHRGNAQWNILPKSKFRNQLQCV